jgi:hypothetical protein
VSLDDDTQRTLGGLVEAGVEFIIVGDEQKRQQGVT